MKRALARVRGRLCGVVLLGAVADGEELGDDCP